MAMVAESAPRVAGEEGGDEGGELHGGADATLSDVPRTATSTFGASSMRRSDIFRVDDDAEKLQRFHETGGATGGGPPNYLAKTIAFTAHTLGKKRQPVKKTTRELQTYDKTKWCAEDREAARSMLVQMQFRYNYMRNPRHLKVVRDPSTNLPLTSGPLGPHFKVMPPAAEFRDYEAGGVYELVLEFQNISPVGRRLRLVEPSSALFTMSLLRFPPDSGQVAPGMVAACLIRFSPDSNGDYDDELHVQTEAGLLSVPLRGRRQPPRLSLSPRLDTGWCFTGDRVSSNFEFVNEGGRGRFCLVPESWEDGNEAIEIGESLTLEPFTVGPAEFDLESGQSMALRVDFSPTANGATERACLLLCDNCEVRRLTLYGGGCVPDISVTKFVHMDVRLGRDPPRMLEFPPTQPNGLCVKTIVAENRNPLPLPFHWSSFKASLRASESDGEMTAGLACFAVSPSMGTFPPHSKTSFQVYFRPVQAVPYAGRIELFVEGIPSTDEEGQLSYSDVSMLGVRLEGRGRLSDLRLFPCNMLFGAELQLGDEYDREFTLTNTDTAPTYFRWETQVAEEGVPEIHMEPAEGLLEGGGVMQIRMHLRPTCSGRFSTQMRCAVQHGKTIVLPVEGSVCGALVELDRPTLNFGLVAVGKTGDCDITVRNVTPGAFAAAWRLQVADGASNASDVLCLPAEGTLQPGEEVVVRVKLTPKCDERVRSTLACTVAGGPTRFVNFQAEAQTPRCYVDRHSIEMGNLPDGTVTPCYVDVPVSQTFTITNANFVPATARWEQVSVTNYDIIFSPAELSLEANESKKVTVTFTARRPVGHVERLVKCRVAGMKLPVAISLGAATMGLTVAFGIQSPPTTLPEAGMSTIEPLAVALQTETMSLAPGAPEQDKPPSLEMGDTPIYRSRSISFFISNKTPIPAEYSLRMERFGEPEGIFASTVGFDFTAGRRPNGDPLESALASTSGSVRGKAPSLRSKGSTRGTVRTGGSKVSRASSWTGGRQLLTNDVDQTQRLVSKSGQERIAGVLKGHYKAEALGQGQGAVFALSKYGGHLEPWGEIFVEVVLHCDRCGRYEDKLTCDMTDSSGTQTVVFDVASTVIGLPLTVFPNQTGVSCNTPNQHLLYMEKSLRATGTLTERDLANRLGQVPVTDAALAPSGVVPGRTEPGLPEAILPLAKFTPSAATAIGPLHMDGGGELLDEELKQWGFKSRFRTMRAREAVSELGAATWLLKFAGRMEGLPLTRQKFTIVNEGSTPIALDWSMFPHELGVHNVVRAESSVQPKPAWAKEMAELDAARKRREDAIEFERSAAIAAKKLAALLESSGDGGDAGAAGGEEGEVDEKAAAKAAEVLRRAQENHLFALTQRVEVARQERAAVESQLLKLDRDKIAEVKRTKVAAPAVHCVLRAVLTLLKLAKPKELKKWAPCRKLACAPGFFKTVIGFDTSAKIPEKRLARVRSLLEKAGGEEGARQGSVVALLLYHWVTVTLAVYEQERRHIAAVQAEKQQERSGEDGEAGAAEGGEQEAEGEEEEEEEEEDEDDDEDDGDEDGDGDAQDGDAAEEDGEGEDADADGDDVPDPEPEPEEVQDGAAVAEKEEEEEEESWVSFDFPVYCPQKGELADTTGVFPPYEPRPFRLEPEFAVVPARGSSSFTVTFLPDVAHPTMHNWYLAGDCRYLPDNDEEELPPHTIAELPPMFIGLNAACVRPELTCEHKQINFGAYASPSAGPPPSKKNVTLTNKTAAPLYFTLGTDSQKFEVVSAEVGVGGAEYVSKDAIAAGHKLLLQPGESLIVNVCYLPTKLPRSFGAVDEEANSGPPKPLWKVREEQEAADLLVADTEEWGNLVITYQCGEEVPIGCLAKAITDPWVQNHPLCAQCTYPAVEVVPATVDFGKLLVGRPVQRTVQIRNTSQAHLEWTLLQAESPNFELDRKAGLLPPQVAGEPVWQEVVVTFTATSEDTYDKVVQVKAHHGRSAVLRLRAVGSFDEVDERWAGRTGFADGLSS